jgi:hypothetical protein
MTPSTTEYLLIPLPPNIRVRQLPTMPDPCWEWTGGLDADGYGRTKVKGVTLRLHRIFFQLFVGDVQSMQLVRHRCDNPPCCNPNHLRKGTHQDNIADRNERFRTAFGVRNGTAKLDDDKVSELRRRYERGESSPALAREIGLSTSTMQNVLFGRTWRHVPNPCTARSSGWRKQQ